MKINWPLMDNNIIQDDLDVVINFLKGTPRLTQGEQVIAFEEEWSKWLGVKYSVFVNSGASANFITMHLLRASGITGKAGKAIVPTLAWVSDIASTLSAGFDPVFVDIDPDTLGMDTGQIISKIDEQTKVIFLTHVQGFNALNWTLLGILNENRIILIEDCCESYGATFSGNKIGTFGLVSNFSFYYAHHMSTIEGGMICTDNQGVYDIVRMLRSHGMSREARSGNIRTDLEEMYKDSLTPDFIFGYPSFNFRNTEIGAVIGRNQLKRLDKNNAKRVHNFDVFLHCINSSKYKIDFDIDGNCNYAFPLILKEANVAFRDRLEIAMKDANIEFRRGSSGGGNQLRQPYLSNIDWSPEEYPNVEHVHFFGYYIGNYPTLTDDRIMELCKFLNSVE